MAVRILEGIYGGTSGAVLICDTSMTAFGPVFDDANEAERFQTWWNFHFSDTLRSATGDDLANRLAVFRKRVEKVAN